MSRLHPRKIRLGLLLIAVLFILSFQPAFAGFGVSPSLVDVNNLVPGASFERTVYLIQGTPETDLTVALSVDSEQASEWLSFPDADENGHVLIPAGVQQFPVRVQVTVPTDTDLGIYRAFVRANTAPAGNGGQVVIALAGKITFAMTVGDDVISQYSVASVRIHDITPNTSPVVSLTISNTGNVPAGPDAATFELFNKFGDVRLAYGQVDGGIADTPGFSEGDIVLDFPIEVTLGVGEYWGYLKVYEEGKVIKEERTPFRVREDAIMPTNVAAVAGASSSVGLQTIFSNKILLGGGILSLLCLLLAFFLYKKR